MLITTHNCVNNVMYSDKHIRYIFQCVKDGPEFSGFFHLTVI